MEEKAAYEADGAKQKIGQHRKASFYVKKYAMILKKYGMIFQKYAMIF